jgi:hypothetical protein
MFDPDLPNEQQQQKSVQHWVQQGLKVGLVGLQRGIY